MAFRSALFMRHGVKCILKREGRQQLCRNKGSHSSWKSQFVGAGIIGYVQNLKWVPIPLGIGFAYICYQQYGHIKKREQRMIQGASSVEETLAKDWQVTLYRVIPWRFTSRLWGQVNDKNLPERLRQPLLGLYVWLFGCDVTEALVEDLTYYKNLQEFFKRQLKPEVRPIDQQHALVSPCDGKVLHYGEVKHCMLEQVKGVTYCLKTFLGPNNWYSDDSEDTNPSFAVDKITDEEYLESLNIKEGNKLFNCIIYLAPGDYHRFHSPTSWSAAHRRHFPGELFSVNPGIAAWIKGLFNLNERVVITGQWQCGFFSMAAVGATNVGSINIYFDKELNTNVKGAYADGAFHDKSLRKVNPESKSPEKMGISLDKGAGIGEFNLGSTIVLIFEAPEDFRFNIEQGEKVKFGERLGSM
ncbi:phosphatidylserine decarboxylase proenzyme, mitochondrial-like isoform X2 [Apostichopus japonicus]|uniref:phosphatidylserine decarboxylase proenzyme, mitochondrial-like isoform X2 n=1 Tax=Stichopus japonicus TaxID=307972 RepID=UPI003AB7E674